MMLIRYSGSLGSTLASWCFVQWHVVAADVGYLRFIFYFGVFGLIAISAVMCKAAIICSRIYKAERVLFFLLLAINFLVWFKVSTDIFLVFALFLVAGDREDKDAEPVSQLAVK